jgi:DNA-binding transcriptional MocR family regulator
MLDTSAVTSRVDQVIAHIEGRIARRDLIAGARAPSLRRLAEDLGVSKSTVVEAYDRMVANGVLTSRPGSGFVVARQLAPLMLAPVPARNRDVDPYWIMRQSLATHGPAPKPGCGWLPDSWMPVDALRKALKAVSRTEDTGLVTYGEPLGYRPLREQICRRLAERQIEAPPDQILTTNGASHALDLICRFFLKPGDAALVDDPCYINFRSILEANGIRSLGVPLTREGVDLDAFQRLCEAERPRLYLTNASLHNPTGLILSGPTLHRILKLIDQHDMVLVEDDVFADFAPSAPRFAAFDGFERVVYVGGFSKTITAAGRTGFIAGRPDWIDGLTDLKLATTFGANEIAARTIHALLSDGTYRRHVEALNRRLAAALPLASGRLAALGLTPWITATAGFFIWAEIPDGGSSEAVARAASAEGLVLAPGNLFSVGARWDGHMRFNAAQCQSPATIEAIGRAIRAAR